MIIGHLPAGYICSKLLFPRFAGLVRSSRAFVIAGVMGAIAPDLDMIYFYAVDHRQHHHHTYWTHYPILWLCLLSASAIGLRVGQRRIFAALAFVFSLNGVLHMLLDTIVGDIWWFAPFWDRPFALLTVPIVFRPWWLNFFFHWSFVFELCVVLWALIIWKGHAPQKGISAAKDRIVTSVE